MQCLLGEAGAPAVKEAMESFRLNSGPTGPSVRGATRFFWVWLVCATGASVAGNVAHAVLNAPKGSAALAAAAAVVPPAVLLGSTHSVAQLVKARRIGPTYWCALLMTLALTGCAFVLSFDALSDLAMSLGMQPDRAWLWPCAIDLSIAQSTMALLSLTGPARIGPPPTVATVWSAESPAYAPEFARSPNMSGQHDLAADHRPPTSAVAETNSVAEATPLAPSNSVDDSAKPAQNGTATANRWQSAAHGLVRAGITRKDPEVVAQILAEHEAGTPPSAIGRRLDVHHTTVRRILTGARELVG
jgi:hypothetical protein